MGRVREREVSTRLIRPTLAEIHLKEVLEMVQHFNPEWEMDGKITVCFLRIYVLACEETRLNRLLSTDRRLVSRL